MPAVGGRFFSFLSGGRCQVTATCLRPPSVSWGKMSSFFGVLFAPLGNDNLLGMTTSQFVFFLF